MADFLSNLTSAARSVASDVASLLPQQGADFWVFPGGTLRLPAAVMNGLTNLSNVINGRPPSTATRLRFVTTSVHQYDTKTVTLDASLAYFAGIRDIQPFSTTYIASQDPEVFSFSRYDPSQWVLHNTAALDSGPITTAGSVYAVLNPQFDTDLSYWTQSQGSWSWDNSLGRWYPGTAKVTADGTTKLLVSSVLSVTPGTQVRANAWVAWSGLSAASGSSAIQMRAVYSLNGTPVSTATVATLSYTPWAASTPTLNGDNWAQLTAEGGTKGGTVFTIPAGVNQLQLALVVTSSAAAGTVWFDTVEVGSANLIEGYAYKDFVTSSTFSAVRCAFSDSGLVRSDSMWQQSDPNDANTPPTALAYYVDTIPSVLPSGMWGDTIATWASAVAKWGNPYATSAIAIDPNRIYQNKRVLHFTRAADPTGATQAGIVIRQSTNFTPSGLFRIGCVFFKNTATDNQIEIALTRVSDGVVIHQESFEPVVGYWYEYQTSFIELPDSDDQVYRVSLTLFGQQADDLYLNDLYCEVALVRYFMRLGGESAFLHDVTPLRYANSIAVVSCTTPVQEFDVQVAILSPRAHAYGCALEPLYLK